MNSHSERSPIYVIGTNAGGLANLPIQMQNLVLMANKVAAPQRLLQEFPKWWAQHGKGVATPELFNIGQTNDLINWITEDEEAITVLLASGDPLWFGIGRKLLGNFPPSQLKFHPSPTSMQLAFSRIGRSWEGTEWVSLHGRDPSQLISKLKNRPELLAILTDPTKGGLNEVRSALRTLGLEDNYSFWIFEQLGHKDEKIWSLSPNDEILEDIHPLHMVILMLKNNEFSTKKLPLFGIEDGLFLQNLDRPGLMTKREVRVQLLADLELPIEGVLWDLCAGVGSIGLEALRINPRLKALFIEKRGGGAETIRANALRLEVNPKAIIEAEALTYLIKNDLPFDLKTPDRVIIGGGGPQRNELIKLTLERLSPEGILVIPMATIEEIYSIKDLIISSGYIFTLNQHQAARGLPLAGGTRLCPMNPVFIVKGKRCQHD